MTIEVRCRICGEKTPVEVTADAYMKWQTGTLIQDAIPELSREHRELLISQTCNDCFEGLFAEDK